jgi:hypothetical protein
MQFKGVRVFGPGRDASLRSVAMLSCRVLSTLGNPMPAMIIVISMAAAAFSAGASIWHWVPVLNAFKGPQNRRSFGQAGPTGRRHPR